MNENNERLRLPDLLNELNNSPNQGSQTLYIILIENLSMMNLAFGHRLCNNYINDLIASIKGSIEGFDKLYKIQSDQIAVIIDETKPSNIIHIDQKVREFIRKFGHGNSNNKDLHISCTTGYSLINDTPDNVLSNAYAEAMNPHPDKELLLDHESSMQKKSLIEMDLANQIESAISGKKLKFAYQPIISSLGGEASHYEALLRIQNEKGELESAGVFIPIAERMGFIDVIDVLTLTMAIDKLKTAPDLHLALNISNLTIGNKKWLKTYFDNINEDVAKRLIIEITETAASRNIRETAFFAATLQETGCQVALDDFGSGYTSFRQVSALSIDMIKIDGLLIEGIENNPNNQVLVKSLLDYMKGMGIKTVAEYVNNGAAAKLLIEYGVDYLQGNYFGEPVALQA